MTAIFMMYGISTLLIILGFIALLKQKTYIDPETKQPTEVEVPVLGKLKTNYPALVFIFLGFAAAYFAFNKTKSKDLWTIQGSFAAPPNKKINWEKSDIWLKPIELTEPPRIDNNGIFTISVLLDQGLSFEDAIESIQFTLDSAQVEPLLPMNEFKKYRQNQHSLLSGTNPHERYYKKLPLNFY
ncbi:MAG TPA: hypothetical protein VL832_22280 [Puia sp.]|nr:hypothetical protein [Puia sp.]